ncbi:hypothetical protein W02_17340 [Nitrospira sp. KM1]|uniref:hypothetical protein n=1 Tax=Nitrospira sp. KM1 TaxID=1936990 RepID=UPI0013A7938A|nr:hypothetical protein [Nitrospira sp. KM1]BCA54594.1 hypothetical protein W02_17340 [Nitrospira sp. KM1]
MSKRAVRLGILCGVMALTGFTSEPAWTADKIPADSPSTDQPEKRGILGDRFSLDAGMKFWVAKWQPAGFVGGINSTRTSDTTAMMGPSITGTVRLRNDEWWNALSVNFTWLQAGGFDFSPFGFNNGGNGPPIDQTSAIRRDYSIVGALSIWRGFGVFAGYYNMQQRFSSSYPGAVQGPAHESVYISGPLIGLFGSGTVSGPLKAYGNLAVGFYDEKSNNNPSGTVQTTAKGVQGYSAEFGLSLDGPSLKVGSIGSIGSAIQMGFRAQVINVNTGQTANNDVTWGPTFQVVARF